MGIFGLFKKEEEKKAEKVRFGQLEIFLDGLKKDKENNDKILVDQIRHRIGELLAEFKEELIILGRVDVDVKKAEERVKLIVKENLNLYMHFLERFIEDLGKIQYGDSHILIREIDELFISFDKKSKMSFEKATFLIGKEFENVKNSIKKFFIDFKDILRDNKEAIENSQLILLIEKRISDIRECEDIEKSVEKTIKEVELGIKNNEKNRGDMEAKIRFIKESKDYREIIEKQDRIKNEGEEIKKKISHIRSLIDFKTLQRIYHTNGKKMNRINELQNDFLENFYSDYGDSIIEIVAGANIDVTNIRNKILEIKSKIEELNKIKIPEDKIPPLNEILHKLNIEREELNEEKKRELEKKEHLREKKLEIMESLKKEALSFNVYIE